MIKFENTITPSANQWNAILLSMRNPMNSWNKSDSRECPGHNCDTCDWWRLDNSICDCDHLEGEFIVGPNDYSLMTKLAKAGRDHRKFMRMITVYTDITAPLYW